MAATWGLRSGGYKFGVILLFLGSLFYVIGYSSPYWTHVDSHSFSVHSGLWVSCVSGSYVGSRGTRCSGGSAGVGWFQAVQAFQSIGLIGVVVSCIYSIFTNCCQSVLSYKRFLEIFAAGSGVVGFVSVMIYVGKTATLLSDSYSWAFGLDLTGCIILIIAALIIACNNNPNSGASTAQPVYYPGEPVQGGNTIVVESYGPGPYQPPGGVAGYPQTYAMPPQYPPQYPAGVPPQYPSAPAQGYGWGAPPPPQGYGGQFQGYSGYNYPYGYSGAPSYSQTPPLEPKPPQ